MKTLPTAARRQIKLDNAQGEYEVVLDRINRRAACRCRGLRHECPGAAQLNADITKAHELAVFINAEIAQGWFPSYAE